MTDVLLALLRKELEEVKRTEPELDPTVLDKLLAGMTLDIGMDNTWGPRMDESPSDAPRIMQDMAERWEQLPPECQAFFRAGIRVLEQLDITGEVTA